MSVLNSDLTRGHPARQILLFSLPLLIGNVFQQFYNMADMIIVGRIINTRALAAIGATGAISFLVIGVSFGLTSGFTVTTAQRYGARDHDGVRRSVATCIMLSLAISAVLTVITMSSAYWLFQVMKTPADIIDDSYSYIIVIYGGTAVTVFFNLFSGILRALGDSVTPLIFLVIACVVNIILDYVFIATVGMGVAGAGWATVISQGLAVVLCFAYSLKRFPILRLRRSDWTFSWPFAKKHLAIGLSMAAQMAILAISVMFLQVAVNSLGTDSIKAYSSAVKIDQLATQPLASLGIAIATFSAQNFGARKILRIRQAAKYGVIISCIGGALGWVVMVTAGGWFLGLFGLGANEPEVVREARLYLSTASIFYFFLGILFVFRNTLQGMGKNTMPMLASGIEILVRVFVTFPIVARWGFLGLCFINPTCWFGAVVVLVTGYYLAMRNLRFDERPGFESVVMNYSNQGKFGPGTEAAPTASVRIKQDTIIRKKGSSESVRFL